MKQAPTVTLNNGVLLPQIGFGLFQIPPDTAEESARAAIEIGYRHLDTAVGYGNEEGTGRAVRSSGLPREDLFVTTKLPNSDHGYQSTLASFERSRARLGLEYVDLYLIHFPCPTRLAYHETWRAFERLYADGVVRAIGISNFKFPYLQRLLTRADVAPAVHQIEVHPTYQQAELDAMSRDAGSVVEAYSPLGRAADLAHPSVIAIASRLGATPAQVILAWHLARGRVVIPKSSHPQRMAENLAAAEVTLTTEDLTSIDELEAGLRTGEDIETFN